MPTRPSEKARSLDRSKEDSRICEMATGHGYDIGTRIVRSDRKMREQHFPWFRLGTLGVTVIQMPGVA